MTPLSGLAQGSNPVLKDSLRCYTPVELRAIAMKLIDGRECDTLLKIANAVIRAKDTTIASQDRTIIKQDIRFMETEHLVDECNLQKGAIQSDLKKAKRRLTWTKVGWAATTVVLTVTTVLALIK